VSNVFIKYHQLEKYYGRIGDEEHWRRSTDACFHMEERLLRENACFHMEERLLRENVDPNLLSFSSNRCKDHSKDINKLK
jgi:hypothetical protein